MKLPIQPPFLPMEAKNVADIPTGPEWQYEPKWDGFRCIAFRDGATVELQSKAGQSLTRYLPELVEALRNVKARRFVLDGEIIRVSVLELARKKRCRRGKQRPLQPRDHASSRKVRVPDRVKISAPTGT